MTTLVLHSTVARAEGAPWVASPKVYPAVWLFSLLPVSVLVALDVSAGVMRPLTWLARFTPALLTLALVAWATLSSRPRALRVRKELRLLSPTALLLAMSGLQWFGDAQLLSGAAVEFLTVVGTAITFPLVALVAITPWSEEQRLGTMLSLSIEPRSTTIGLEKFTLSAFFIVSSALQLEANPFVSERVLVASRIAHLLALTLAPALFFKTRSVSYAMAAFAAIPIVLVIVPAAAFDFEWPAAFLYLVASLGGITVLLISRQSSRIDLARPVEALPLHGFRLPTFAESRTPIFIRIEAKLMTGALMVAALTPLVLLLPRTMAQDVRAALFILPTLMGFLVCAIAPALTLAEPSMQIEHALTIHTRARVFCQKLFSSFIVAVVGGMVLPFAFTAWSSTDLNSNFDVMWLIFAVTFWAVSFALSTVLKSAGTVLAATVGSVLGAFAVLFFAQAAGGLIFGDHLSLINAPWVPLATMAVVAPAAVTFAWFHFVKQVSASRVAIISLGVCASHAAILGAFSVALERFTRQVN